MAAEILDDADPAVAWCQLNAEGDLLTKLIDGAVQVSGSDDPTRKRTRLAAFSRRARSASSSRSPIIGAWGLNWQHCNRMTFFPSHSYEQYYQAVRRSWRFGQTRPVTVDLVTTEGGINAPREPRNAKPTRPTACSPALIAHMRDALAIDQTNQLRPPSGGTTHGL